MQRKPVRLRLDSPLIARKYDKIIISMAPKTTLRCKICVLPVDKALTHGYLGSDSEGVCDFCRSHRRRFSKSKDTSVLKSKLDKVIEWAKRSAKGRYDCLVPISGGKDSLAVLDYLTTTYRGLRILTVTIDNGFLNPESLDRCKKVTGALGVDHVLWQPPHIRKLAKIFLEKTGHFCCPCEITLMNVIHKLTWEHRIPLVALGSSTKYDGAHPETANPWTPPFFEEVIRDEKDKDELRKGVADKFLLLAFGMRVLSGAVKVLTLPDYLEWNKTANRETLNQKYGVNIGEEHEDCLAAPVADWLYKRRCGFGQKASSIAALVRNGLISRDEGLKMLEDIDEFGETFPEDLARFFLEGTGMSVEEVKACSLKKPDPYFNLAFKALSLARKAMSLSIA